MRSLAAVAVLVTYRVVFTRPASGSLGGELTSIEAPDETVVDEYVSPAGTVFAVAWHGPFVPDMQQILGSYFGQSGATVFTLTCDDFTTKFDNNSYGITNASTCAGPGSFIDSGSNGL